MRGGNQKNSILANGAFDVVSKLPPLERILWLRRVADNTSKSYLLCGNFRFGVVFHTTQNLAEPKGKYCAYRRFKLRF
jgi:hypothetical protein